jgi:glutathione S-transferase
LEEYYSTKDHARLMPEASHKREWTREVTRIAETENPHNIYEPIELLYLHDWKWNSGTIVQAYHDIFGELGFWEKYAKESKFISGDEFGMADCAFYPILAYMIHRGLKLENYGFLALQGYVERCAVLGAVTEARPDGWEEPGKSLFTNCERLVERANQEGWGSGRES